MSNNQTPNISSYPWFAARFIVAVIPLIILVLAMGIARGIAEISERLFDPVALAAKALLRWIEYGTWSEPKSQDLFPSQPVANTESQP